MPNTEGTPDASGAPVLLTLYAREAGDRLRYIARQVELDHRERVATNVVIALCDQIGGRDAT